MVLSTDKERKNLPRMLGFVRMHLRSIGNLTLDEIATYQRNFELCRIIFVEENRRLEKPHLFFEALRFRKLLPFLGRGFFEDRRPNAWHDRSLSSLKEDLQKRQNQLNYKSAIRLGPERSKLCLSLSFFELDFLQPDSSSRFLSCFCSPKREPTFQT